MDKQIINPYRQYMYSYPHKTAYRALEGISLEEELVKLKGQQNSLYFHIPFCQYKCGYCNLFSVAGKTMRMMGEYVDAMEKHSEQLSAIMPEGVEFQEITLGGGTPLILPESLLERVFEIAVKYFGVSLPGIPVMVETSPNQTTESKLKILKKYGVTRLSIGVQSFEEGELINLKRMHTAKAAEQALRLVKEVGFDCVNVDMIYGIPGQTKKSFLASLEKAVYYEPEEVFVYPLYIKRDTRLWDAGYRQREDALELYYLGRNFLKMAGYRQDSMRRFVWQQEYSERENMERIASIYENDNMGRAAEIYGMGNRERAASLCGFGNTLSVGCGGRSYIGNLHFSTPYEVRKKQCVLRLEEYIKQENYLEVNHGFLLSEEEMKRRYVIRHILFGQGILQEDYWEHFGGDVMRDFPLLIGWCEGGYAVQSEEYITLTEKGLALSDYLGAQLISDEVRERMEKWWK